MQEVDVEVIEPQKDAVYKPRIGPAKERSLKTGDLKPLVGALKAADASPIVIEHEVTDVTVSSALRRAMAMPNEKFSAGERIVNNAEAIGQVLLRKALVEGDLSAIREILNRTEGKVPNVTHNTSASVNVKGDANSIAALMQKIDGNKG